MSIDKSQSKIEGLPLKIRPPVTTTKKRLPTWIRVRVATDDSVSNLKTLLREHRMVTVCEEASCPNLHECFGKGTATFMIMGDKCTRRCTFCDVAHGKPKPLDPNEPLNLAQSLSKMGLKYVVITSVDRDDLLDGGAAHFAECIKAAREHCPNTRIEILTPDFRGRMDIALDRLSEYPPDVFNHNLETVPRIYKTVRPGSDYAWSLMLLKKFKARFPHIPTKSGIMLGIGETDDEVIEVLKDLRAHDCEWLTLGQYLQPSKYHHPVERYVTPQQFDEFKQIALSLGFHNVASGPMVRSSYHADKQAEGEVVV
jgi:lipoic acid synthetase